MMTWDRNLSISRTNISRHWYSTVDGVDSCCCWATINKWLYSYGQQTDMFQQRSRNRIKRIRQELGLRQLDLARHLNVYQSEVSAIERGEREPGISLAKRIARALGRRVEEVF